MNQLDTTQRELSLKDWVEHVGFGKHYSPHVAIEDPNIVESDEQTKGFEHQCKAQRIKGYQSYHKVMSDLYTETKDQHIPKRVFK